MHPSEYMLTCSVERGLYFAAVAPSGVAFWWLPSSKITETAHATAASAYSCLGRRIARQVRSQPNM